MKLAFLGDSITLGYGLDNPSQRYATLLCRALGAEEVNFGITGTLMARAGMNRNDGNSFLDRLGQLSGYESAVVFGGTNDYFWSDTPIFPANALSGDLTVGSDVSLFSVALERICRALTEQRPTEQNLLVTPYPHFGVGNYSGGENHVDCRPHRTDSPNYHGLTLYAYVEVTEEIGNRFGIPVLNLFRDFPFDYTVHTMDGCHPNPIGHRLLAEAIQKRICRRDDSLITFSA